MGLKVRRKTMDAILERYNFELSDEDIIYMFHKGIVSIVEDREVKGDRITIVRKYSLVITEGLATYLNVDRKIPLIPDDDGVVYERS